MLKKSVLFSFLALMIALGSAVAERIVTGSSVVMINPTHYDDETSGCTPCDSFEAENCTTDELDVRCTCRVGENDVNAISAPADNCQNLWKTETSR